MQHPTEPLAARDASTGWRCRRQRQVQAIVEPLVIPFVVVVRDELADGATQRALKRWSLTSLQQRLVKTGGRLVKHARYYWLLLAEGHLTRRLFGDMLRRIWALPVPAG